MDEDEPAFCASPHELAEPDLHCRWPSVSQAGAELGLELELELEPASRPWVEISFPISKPVQRRQQLLPQSPPQHSRPTRSEAERLLARCEGWPESVLQGLFAVRPLRTLQA